ncbi:UDP-N-acetylmuramate dehydrogenase [Polluticoccus soli]|uniref:UDP-N-acetylmuramate dehydrogenase n=1 Tax=Polluticoccus soli TaxID=3034150 RepID=UPI0023E2E6AE|nr:UDP-N-acetylmuramate dehydrogenase [Flavipsychrobacter sp. JY13-12]
MQIRQNVSLKPYNTFGIDIPAESFIEINDHDALADILTDKSLPAKKNILGGGSNVLLTQPVKGLTILNKGKGIIKVNEDDEKVWIDVNSGEVWHDLVLYSINNGWAGIENLSLIPGTVGASPMQNIGAYGVEAKETIESVTFWHLDDKAYITLNNNDCRFGYRDSIFKHELKNKVFITSVRYRLNKIPTFNISYGAIEQELEKMNVTELSIKAISDAVISIRTSKLPDPKQIGNAGSFFKNPSIAITQYIQLKEQYPDMPSYPVNESQVKIPAGWLIEQCGWKGFRDGNIGVHQKQALVLVNYGGGSGSDIWALSEKVLNSVHEKYGIDLEREVQVW